MKDDLIISIIQKEWPLFTKTQNVGQRSACQDQMANFIIKRGGTAEVNTIDAVKKTWTSPLNAFEDAYAHECKISARINELLSQAQKEGDNATQDFLWQFVREQVDEEATASGIVDRIKRMGDSSLFNLDEQYGRRQG